MPFIESDINMVTKVENIFLIKKKLINLDCESSPLTYVGF